MKKGFALPPWPEYTVGMEQKDLEKLLAEIVEAMKQQEPEEDPEEEEKEESD